MENTGTLQLIAYQACHFKPFVDTNWLEIKPITLIFGHNSSGKSALLSVLPMLRQTLEDSNRMTPFVFSSEAGVDLGIYDEVAYNHQTSLETPIWFNFKIGLSYQDYGLRPRLGSRRYLEALEALNIEGDTIEIRIGIKYNKKQRRLAITDFLLLDKDGNQIFKVYRKTTAVNQRWHFEPETTRGNIRLYWDHFLPRIFSTGVQAEKGNPIQNLLTSIANELTKDLLGLVHIGPLRDSPRRAYRLTGESPKDVGQIGENWLNILLQTRTRDQLENRVNEWLGRLGHTLHIEWGRQGYVHPMLKDDTGLLTSLKDAGFGISQILPVLIQGFSSPPGTILILEQPEIHLHPRAQAELGDMLLAISQRGVRLLVETHSEHLLLRLRRRIAESQLDHKNTPILRPEDTAIYYVERQGQQSETYRVEIDRMGEFIDPPERFQSFFSDDYEETLKWGEAVARIVRGSDNAHSD